MLYCKDSVNTLRRKDIAAIIAQTNKLGRAGMAEVQFAGDGSFRAYLFRENSVVPAYYNLEYVGFGGCGAAAPRQNAPQKIIKIYRAGGSRAIVQLTTAGQ